MGSLATREGCICLVNWVMESADTRREGCVGSSQRQERREGRHRGVVEYEDGPEKYEKPNVNCRINWGFE